MGGAGGMSRPRVGLKEGGLGEAALDRPALLILQN